MPDFAHCSPTLAPVRVSDFRLAGLLAAVMVGATALIAVVWRLPIRDPDSSVGAMYLLIPLIVAGAIGVDIVPRALWRTRRAPDGTREGLRRCVAAVARERWSRVHLTYTLVGLGTWYVAYAAFRNLKSYVPWVNDNLYDRELADLDRVLFLGSDPAEVVHVVFGTGWTAHFFSFVYVLWIVLLPTSLAIALVWSGRGKGGAWWVTAISVDWALGAATYFLVPSLGPAYTDAAEFADLPGTWVSGMVTSMMDDRVEQLADPWAAGAPVQTIAAFASLHVAVCVTACLMAHLLRFPYLVKVSLWVFLGLTEISTIYFGWHFFVDTLGGVVLGSAAVWIAAVGTGNHVRGWPRLAPDETLPSAGLVPGPRGAADAQPSSRRSSRA